MNCRTKLLRTKYLPALHIFFERFDSTPEFSAAELKETEDLFYNLSMCLGGSSESPTVVTSTIFRDDLFSMDRIVQLFSLNHHSLAKIFLESFVRQYSPFSHPLMVEIVTSGTLERLLDIFEPLSLPFTTCPSTPSPTDYSVQGQHPDTVHKFIVRLIRTVLNPFSKLILSSSHSPIFKPSQSYDAMAITLNLTRDYLRRVCQTSKLVTHIFEESEIFGVLGSILLAAPHVDEAYSLLCELPILQAAMIFYETFAERGCSFDFLNDLERLFKPSNSVDAALPDRIAVVRGMVLEEGWNEPTLSLFFCAFCIAILKLDIVSVIFDPSMQQSVNTSIRNVNHPFFVLLLSP
ncbi:hypothetical protein BLNAU_21854 [Blattamonas nauphoetae]|uniref:Uncharacterized protein n=1 Tax=Blattamonas nauphoetae TaxID=2049346 RepID=A0ABQ9WV72_9EUKA|nr:hypothetical protein BLNAU_21854 [Blattamonas nauphoetae]